MKTFEEAWSEKEAAGYQYGANALEQVRLGWEMRAAAEAEAKACTCADPTLKCHAGVGEYCTTCRKYRRTQG